MSTSEAAAVSCSTSTAGPNIEWLEPKLPDILKNGSSSLTSFTTGEGTLEGNRLEFSTPESSSFSGVRTRVTPPPSPTQLGVLLVVQLMPLWWFYYWYLPVVYHGIYMT